MMTNIILTNTSVSVGVQKRRLLQFRRDICLPASSRTFVQQSAESKHWALAERKKQIRREGE